MKVYVVVSYANGEDYDGSDIYVEGVFTDLAKAQTKMKEVYKEDFAPSEGESAEEDLTEMNYCVTNFDADYHAEVWIKEAEVE